jgi:DNA-binding transcriptional ArsR family regulator
VSDEAIPRHVVGEWVRTRRVDNPATKLILMLVFDHAGPQEDGRWVAWVGNRRLAEEACFAEGANGQRTVRKHLAALQAAGLVHREERRRENGSQTTNRVVLLVGDPPGPSGPGGEVSTDRGGRAVQTPPEAPKRSPYKSQNPNAHGRAREADPPKRSQDHRYGPSKEGKTTTRGTVTEAPRRGGLKRIDPVALLGLAP